MHKCCFGGRRACTCGCPGGSLAGPPPQCCPQPRFDCPSVLRCAAGMLLGVNSLGAVADGLGRRRGFLLSALVLGAAGLASALAPSFAVRCCGCKCDVVPKHCCRPTARAPTHSMQAICPPANPPPAVAPAVAGHRGLCTGRRPDCGHAVCGAVHQRDARQVAAGHAGGMDSR